MLHHSQGTQGPFRGTRADFAPSVCSARWTKKIEMPAAREGRAENVRRKEKKIRDAAHLRDTRKTGERTGHWWRNVEALQTPGGPAQRDN